MKRIVHGSVAATAVRGTCRVPGANSTAFAVRGGRGYTLMEMLIASVLVAALMSVVWGMLSMYNSYLTAGQSQAMEQQLTRSLLQQLLADLQSVAIPDTNPDITRVQSLTGDLADAPTLPAALPAVPLTAGDTSSAESLSVDIGLEALPGFGELTELSPPGRIVLTGHATALRLDCLLAAASPGPAWSGETARTGSDSFVDATSGADLPPADSSLMAAADELTPVEGQAPEVPEYQTIIWQFQPLGLVSSGPGALSSGLYRVQTDSLSLQAALSASQAGATAELGTAAELGAGDVTVSGLTLEALLNPAAAGMSPSAAAEPGAPSGTALRTPPQLDRIPEVVDCRFDYFSGSAWATTWNSAQQGLPLAVRVRLRLMPAEYAAQLSRLTSSGTDSAAGSPTPTPAGSGPPTSDRSGVPGAVGVPGADGAADLAADPFSSIPTRLVQRIILLQPVRSAFPQTEVTDAFSESGTSSSTDSAEPLP